jgi:hypothetical protein
MASPGVPPAMPPPGVPPAMVPPDMPMPETPPAPHELPPGFRRWSRVYVFVLSLLALLIAFFAWLTRVYS